MELDDALQAALTFGQRRSGAADGANQVATALRGGAIELLRGDNHALAKFVIGADSVSPEGELRFTLANNAAISPAGGRAEKAQFRDSTGKVRITDLSVGMPPGQFDVTIDNSWCPKGSLIELHSAVLSFPYTCSEAPIDLDVRIIRENENFIGLAVDLNGGRTRAFPSLPRSPRKNRTHVDCRIRAVMLVAGFEASIFRVEPDRGHLPLYADAGVLPTWQSLVDLATTVAPAEHDWSRPASLVLACRKFSDHDFEVDDIAEMFLAIRDAREADDESAETKVQASQQQQLKMAAPPAEDEDDRWLRDFFNAAMARSLTPDQPKSRN